MYVLISKKIIHRSYKNICWTYCPRGHASEILGIEPPLNVATSCSIKLFLLTRAHRIRKRKCASRIMSVSVEMHDDMRPVLCRHFHFDKPRRDVRRRRTRVQCDLRYLPPPCTDGENAVLTGRPTFCLSTCLSVNDDDNSKSYYWFSMKFEE